jgi:hypothetical protein
MMGMWYFYAKIVEKMYIWYFDKYGVSTAALHIWRPPASST